ncbi:MAG: tetratricopeptide repeat protein [Planctomycetota bacterium]
METRFRYAVAVLAGAVAAGVALLLLIPREELAAVVPPEDRPTWREGISLLQEGRAAEAEPKLRQVLSRTDHPTVRYQLARALAAQPKREEEALREIQAAIRLGFREEKTLGRAEFLAGNLFARLGDWPAAERQLKSALAHYGPDAEIEGALRQVERTRALGEKAALVGDDPAQRLRRAQALAYLDRPAEALPILQEILARDPKNASALRTLGFARVRMGASPENLREALNALDRACKLDPGNARGHLFRGGVLDALGRFEEAVVAFSLGIESQPGKGDETIFLARGFARIHQGRFREARDDFAAAFRLSPGHPVAQEWLAKTDRAVRDASYRPMDSEWIPFDDSKASQEQRRKAEERLKGLLGDEPPANP